MSDCGSPRGAEIGRLLPNELGNLKGAFDRLGRAHPVEHEIPLQEMILSVTSQPFEDMHKAIESKDRVVFSKA